MIYLTIILLVICVILSLLLFKKVKVDEETNELNNKLAYENLDLTKQNKELQNQKEFLNAEIIKSKEQISKIANTVIEQSNQLHDIKEKNEQIAQSAYENYVKVLELSYTKEEELYDEHIADLKADIQNIQNDLDKIKETRVAAHEALLKEQEVKDNKDNYRLLPSQSDLNDARRLELVKRELNKPRILSMLIWQTYWQPIAKKQFPTILQSKTKCGIYKITNTITDECYIGQSVDIYKRWSEHCKCGLGIDTPPGNKLYKAIQEYGLENFTFELLIECSQSELNSKEKYFIELYQADVYGYNGTGGNK